MNDERELARRVVAHLSAAARDIDEVAAQRLRAARERALVAQGPSGRFARLRAGRTRFRLVQGPMLRSATLVVSVLAVLLVGDYWTTWSRVSSLQKVDAALLIDDLPIDAYLDPEFKEWLQRESHS